MRNGSDGTPNLRRVSGSALRISPAGTIRLGVQWLGKRSGDGTQERFGVVAQFARDAGVLRQPPLDAFPVNAQERPQVAGHPAWLSRSGHVLWSIPSTTLRAYRPTNAVSTVSPSARAMSAISASGTGSVIGPDSARHRSSWNRIGRP